MRATTMPQPVSTEIAPDVGVVHQTTRTSLASTAVPEICTIPSADMDKVDDAEEINESVQHGVVDDSLGSNNNDIAPQADIVPLDANGNPRDPNVLYTVDGIKILPPKQKDNNAIARTRLLWILYHKRQLRTRFKERRRTINTSIDACLRGFKNPSERGAVVSVLGEQSQGLGILRPRLSRFLVYALEACETPEDYTVLFDALGEKNFYLRLMLRLSGRNIPVLRHEGFNALINSYVLQFPLIVDEQRLVDGLYARIVNYAGREYSESFRQNILLNYDGRFVRMLFDYFRPWLMTIVRKAGVRKIARKVYRLFRDSNDVTTICPGVNAILLQAGVLNNAYRLLLSGASVLRFYVICNGSKLPEGPAITVTDRLAHALPRMKEVRKLVAKLNKPGYQAKTFSFFPLCKPGRNFIYLDAQVSNGLLNKAELKLDKGVKIDKGLGKPDTLSWPDLLFDLTGSTRNHRVKVSRPPQNNSFQKGNRHKHKVLRKGQDSRQGLHQLRRHHWATRDNLTPAAMSDQSRKIPWIVTHMRTDGIQLVVGMMTMEKNTNANGNMVPRSIRAKGIDALNNVAGYNAITRNLDILREKYGVYGMLKKISREDIPDNLWITGLDPGQKDIVSYSTENFGERNFRLPNHPRTFTKKVDAITYRRNILANHAEKEEARRRKRDPDYENVFTLLNSGSLKNPATVQQYLTAAQANRRLIFEKMVVHDNRRARFNRKRANIRGFANIGKQVAYHVGIKEIWRLKRREEPRNIFRRASRAVMENEKNKIRVVGYGKAGFGHGSRGPTPRKKTIDAIARWVPVKLVNEWRTSKTCHVCFSIMRSTSTYRERVCSNALTPHRSDRDDNASMNMGMIIGFELIFGHRPLHLTWPRLRATLTDAEIAMLGEAAE